MRGPTEPLEAQAVAETTTDGVTTRGWATVRTVRARVDRETGREALRAGRPDATARALVTVRYKSADDLGAGARFVRRDGRVLSAVGEPREVGRRGWLEFLCTEHAPEVAP